MQTRVLRKKADVAWMRSHATTILGQMPGKTVNNTVGLVFVHLVERHLPDAERLIVGEHPAGGVSGSCRFPFLPEELESLTAWLQAYAAKATLDYRCNGTYHSVDIVSGQIVSDTEEPDEREEAFLSFTFLPDTELLGECSPSVRGAVEKAMFLFF